MIRNEEVQKFVDDDVVADIAIEVEQFCVEVQIASGRARRPFVSHRAHCQRANTDLQFGGPFQYAGFEFFFVAPWLMAESSFEAE